MVNEDRQISICSLVPAATEILCELNLEDNIIGVSDLCSYPDSIRSKTKISKSRVITEGFTSAEVESEMNRILELGEVPYEVDDEWFKNEKPDLIITQDNCYICEIDVNYVESRIQGFGYDPEVLVIDPKSISDIYDAIKSIAYSTNKTFEGNRLVLRLSERVDTILDLFKDYRATRVISIEGVNPLVLGGYWIPEMYRMLGCDYGVINPGSSALRIGIEDIIRFDPEFVFVDLCSSSLERQITEVRWLFEQPGFMDVSAIQRGNFYILEHEYFSNPGPRFVDGIELIANVLKPFSGSFPKHGGLKLINVPPLAHSIEDYVGLV